VQRAEIEATVTGLRSYESRISLAMIRRYAFISLPEPLLGGEIEVTDAAGQPLRVIRDESYRWTVHKGKARELKLRYTVPLIHRSLPEVAGRDEYEQPFVAAEHGLLVTGTLFIAPDRGPPADFRVRFRLPQGWALHCPWEETEPGVFTPETLGALWDDLVAIGDWSVRETERDGMRLVVAVAPGQERLEQAAVPFVAEIVGAELELFGFVPRSKYLVLFVTPRATQMAGSPKTGSITMAVPLNDHFTLIEMSHLVALHK
jgi:predicted metalloprotease with PDZ domain